MDTIKDSNVIELGDAIERILVESGLSLSAFSRKVGYSRQYIYELLKKNNPDVSNKIQLDTLKKICDATGYGLARLLMEIGYIPKPTADCIPGTVIIVKSSGARREYHLNENDAALLGEVVKSLAKE